MIDFEGVRDGQARAGRRGRRTVGGGAGRTTRAISADLIRATRRRDSIADVIFVPDDPPPTTRSPRTSTEVGLAWTLGHVIVHLTASAEEAAFLGAELARGVEPHGRSRYEVAWPTLITIEAARARLLESERMILASLDTWPDEPHLDVVFTTAKGTTAERAGPLPRWPDAHRRPSRPGLGVVQPGSSRPDPAPEPAQTPTHRKIDRTWTGPRWSYECDATCPTQFDSRLVERAKGRDPEAFASLVRPRLDRLMRTARAILGHDADAGDALQDALTRAWQGLPGLRDPDQFDAVADPDPRQCLPDRRSSSVRGRGSERSA